ncbi:hypothetical protein F66182_1469 [Fusarium sp. NRRL 66182]|nr:hypothetical protein F66182_1469 [Fusarium sp. NRRL 66182]
MDAHSLLPSSLLTWPPTRRSPDVGIGPGEGKEPSTTDKTVTTAIVCGIALLFFIPVILLAIRWCVRTSRARQRDAEEGIEM